MSKNNLSLTLKEIEQLSGAIHAYLISKYFYKKEIVFGHSLMAFIQFYLLCKESRNMTYFREKINTDKIYRPGQINVFLNSSPQTLSGLYNNKSKQIVIHLKELFSLLQINLSQLILGIRNSDQKVIATKGSELDKYLDINQNEADEIYLYYSRLFKEPYGLVPMTLTKRIPLVFYSGKFVYNDLILRIFQSRHNAGKEIVALQHGGHNYVSSKFNYFLYPEYGFFKSIITAGIMTPLIEYGHVESINIIHRKRSKRYGEHRCVRDIECLALIFGQRIQNPVRVDGNPGFADLLTWNMLTYKFQSLLNMDKVIFKPYPGQPVPNLEKLKTGNAKIAPSISYCYKFSEFLVCDHYGTTFLKSIYKGVLCLLLIDNSIFHINTAVQKIIEPFVISGNSQDEISDVVLKWNSGELNQARDLVLKTLYDDPSLF